ncbi:hypothetical protein RDABS01_011010 [Bienertia sinuspersici]
MVSSKWAARVLLEDINASNISDKTLNELLWERYKVKMTKSTLYRMRNEALTEIHGGVDGCHLSTPERPLVFNSIFISFRGVLNVLFAACRSLIGVDGCHLSGNYGGILLSVVALDGNNELFPFAWAIVPSEDKSMEGEMSGVSSLAKSNYINLSFHFISIILCGIDWALNKLWPAAGRRYYCKHLVGNWKKPFPGPLMFSLFWKACGATSPFTFRKVMEGLKKANLASLVWLSTLGEQSRWSKHKFDPTIKCEVNKTNFVESFNTTLGVDRCRPVLTLLEDYQQGDKYVKSRTGRTFVPMLLEECKFCAMKLGLVRHFSQKMWLEMDLPIIHPPKMSRGIGRPNRNRKRSANEEPKGKRSKDVQRSKCKSFGHNAKTCKGGSTARETKMVALNNRTQMNIASTSILVSNNLRASSQPCAIED